jgi:hypothetical protein
VAVTWGFSAGTSDEGNTADGIETPVMAGVEGVDLSRPHPARIYDHWLGGKDSFAADL